jgi:hypothetical protein
MMRRKAVPVHVAVPVCVVKPVLSFVRLVNTEHELVPVHVPEVAKKTNTLMFLLDTTSLVLPSAMDIQRIKRLRPASSLLAMAGVSLTLGECCVHAEKDFQIDVLSVLLPLIPLLEHEVFVEMYSDIRMFERYVPHIPVLNIVDSLECDVVDLSGKVEWGVFQDTLLQIFKDLKIKTFVVLHFTLSEMQMKEAKGNISKMDGCIDTEEHFQLCNIDYVKRSGVVFDEGVRDDRREVESHWFVFKRAVHLYECVYE